MTVINEAYIPACPAVVQITMPPSNTLSPAPRKVNIYHVLVYAFHPLVLVVGFIPVILLGWLGFIFLQYPSTFGQFVYFSYLVLPFLVQLSTATFRAYRAYWYMKYGAHGIAKIRSDPVGLEVLDATTHEKVLDLGLRALQAIPASSDEPIVLYNAAQPTRHLSLLQYQSAFYVRFETIRMRATFQVFLAALTVVGLVIELAIVLTAPVWSGIHMFP